MIHEVSQLLYREAHLLDSGMYTEWLELLARDIRYWAPVRADVARAEEAANEADRLLLFDETKESLALRVKRLGTGYAWSDIPGTRTRRFVSNIAMESGEGAILRIRSNLMLFKSRSENDETILVAARQDRWSHEGHWLLKERKILIDHRSVENLSVFL